LFAPELIGAWPMPASDGPELTSLPVDEDLRVEFSFCAPFVLDVAAAEDPESVGIPSSTPSITKFIWL
jgi:hypothetical protein